MFPEPVRKVLRLKSCVCSWGTKGSTTVSTDLGVVKSSGDEKDKVDVDIPVDDGDIDAAYEDAKHVLAQCVDTPF